jgi:predicted RND superfamily exporter protein
MIIGIAADDLFVFIDAWRQSKTIDLEVINTPQKRMAYTFRRASHAMSITSSTTAVAFLASLACPIMPIRSASIFAGILIPTNFFIVVLVFPSAVIFYEEHIENNEKFNFCYCLNKKNKGNVEQVETQRIETFFKTTWSDFV